MNNKRITIANTVRAKFLAYSKQIKNFWVFVSTPHETEEAINIAKIPIRVGAVTIGLFFGVFGLWALIAPLDSASISTGTVIVSSNRKTIQHLEGGIIKHIHVKDGDTVSKNTLLVSLDDTAIQANLNVLRKQLLALTAKETRLIAERDLQYKIDFHLKVFLDLGYDEIERVMNSEKNQFNVHQKLIKEQLTIYQQKIKQLNEEVSAISSQKKAASTQLRLINKELKANETLHKQGYVPLQTIMDTQKQQAELQGQIGAYASTVAKAKQAIAETKIDSIKFQTEMLNQVITELQEVQVTMADLKERVTAAQDTLDRTRIRAQQEGIVTGLQYHTIGGVVAPGNPILEIVPQHEELIIQAKLLPKDVDVVHKGLTAKVRISASKAKNTPTLNGTVIHISADRFVDPNTGMPFFLAKIRLPESELKKLKGLALSPGMAAEVYVVTGKRTFLRYFFTPITDTLRKTFKEN